MTTPLHAKEGPQGVQSRGVNDPVEVTHEAGSCRRRHLQSGWYWKDKRGRPVRTISRCHQRAWPSLTLGFVLQDKGKWIDSGGRERWGDEGMMKTENVSWCGQKIEIQRKGKDLKWGCSGTKHSLKHPYKKKGCWGLIFFSSRHNAVLMLWLGSGVKKHVVILRTTLCFSWKCLFNSPQAWLEMSWGILKSTQFCHLKRASKWPDFLWKMCGFGCHKHGRKCPQAFLKKLILWLQIWL